MWKNIFYFRLFRIEILILPRRFSRVSLVKLQHLGMCVVFVRRYEQLEFWDTILFQDR